MGTKTNDELRNIVRDNYAKIALAQTGSCGCSSTSCCDTGVNPDSTSLELGYSTIDLSAVPQGANLGLGCGNPQAIASLKPGETVLDLGSGAGFDCFLAARQVGTTGKVIGVDMTPAMVSKARANANKGAYKQVEFRLGEIENLPLADASVDVIISNCVINLSPDKARVFTEAYRVLKSGGRLAISDVVAPDDLPDHIKNDLSLLAGCMSGATPIKELESLLIQAGFTGIQIQPKDESKAFIKTWAPEIPITDYVVSATIQALKA